MNAPSLTRIQPETSDGPLQGALRFGAGDIASHLKRASHCTQHQCYEQALEAWKRVTYLHPDSAYAQLSLGGVLTELCCWPEAIVAFQQAALLQPNLKEAHYGLGMAYGQLGLFRQAIEAFQQATRIAPEVASRTFYVEQERLYTIATSPATTPSHAIETPILENGKRKHSAGKATIEDRRQSGSARRFWGLWPTKTITR